MTAHPEATLVNEAGQPITYGSRRNYCPNNAVYRQHSARIVQAMAEHYAGNPPCDRLADRQRVRWAVLLPGLPGCVPTLASEALRDAGCAECEPGAPSSGATSTRPGSRFRCPWSTTGLHNPALALNYRRFISDSYVEYQRAQIDILREACPGVPITHNLMGFGYPNLDYFDLTDDLDWVSWDNYPRIPRRA